MSDYQIKLSDINKSFGNKRVLEEVSLNISAGEVVGLVGLNGAGKTTLIRVMLGLLDSDGGRCSILGRDPKERRGDFYNRIGVVLEHNGFDGNLTVMDNLLFYARARGISKQDMENYFNRWWGKSAIDVKGKRVKYFSRGQKMMCALCRSFMGWPDVFLLDEPVVALDVSAYGSFCTLVNEAKNRGSALLISSHQLDAINDLCDSVVILEDGKLNALPTVGGPGGDEEWLIKPEAGATLWKEKIEEVYKIDVSIDGDYIKCVIKKNSGKIIPDIVSLLVNSGCRICEVHRSGLKDSIQKYYSRGSRRESL